MTSSSANISLFCKVMFEHDFGGGGGLSLNFSVCMCTNLTDSNSGLYSHLMIVFTVVVRRSTACLAINGFSQEDEEDRKRKEGSGDRGVLAAER